MSLRTEIRRLVFGWGLPNVVVAGFVLTGCLLTGCQAPETSPAAPLGRDSPRVFFVGLEAGAEISPITELRFGAENFRIRDVGDGFVREGEGHFHLGIDTDCLPPFTLVPHASPWIHFGSGDDSIEMELLPGPRRLVLQAGDAEHRTLDLPGLCQVLPVVVTTDSG